MIIEGINKKNRNYFKKNVKKINKSYQVLFKSSNAYIKLIQPYNLDNSWIITASKAKKELLNFIDSFKLYQFNN